MKKKKVLITLVVTVSVLLVGVTAYAGHLASKDITCPNCGSKIEMPDVKFDRGPMGGGRGGMMVKTLDELKSKLDEQVASGEITQEEADAKIVEFEKMQEERESRRAEMEEKMANGEIAPEKVHESPMGRGRGRGMGAPMDGNHKMPSPHADESNQSATSATE